MTSIVLDREQLPALLFNSPAFLQRTGGGTGEVIIASLSLARKP